VLLCNFGSTVPAKTNLRSAVIKCEAHALKSPLGRVLVSGEVSLEHKSHPHGVSTARRRVHGGSERSVQLEFVRFNGNHLRA